MNSIDQSILKRRFDLRRTQYLPERFMRSPNITERCSVSDHLHISYAVQDASALPLIQESLLLAYRYAKDWFGYRCDISLDLWVAPEVVDLQFMTCLPCDEGLFCAPADQNGMKTILFVSPLSCKRNAEKDCLSGLLAHEITHHVVADISHATLFSMKRKEEVDVPMWLEEGLCQLIQSEVHSSLRHKWGTDIAATSDWYNLEDLWNDLSSCEDVRTAYLQAYNETKTLLKTKGKTEIIQLLYLNRTNKIDWNDFHHEWNKKNENQAC